MVVLRMIINIDPPAHGDSIGFKLTSKNTVASVDYSGPAQIAGIMKGDVLTSIMGRTINTDATNAGQLMLAQSIESARQMGLQVAIGIKRQADRANEMTLGGMTGASHS